MIITNENGKLRKIAIISIIIILSITFQILIYTVSKNTNPTKINIVSNFKDKKPEIKNNQIVIGKTIFTNTSCKKRLPRN